MHYIKRHFKFAGGHRLSKHEGLCKNIHGHNYDVWVTVKSPKLNKNDMVIDFSDLKAIADAYLKQYDHCLVLNINDMHWMKPLADKMGFKTTIMNHEEQDPTAEVMAETFFKFINDQLISALFEDVRVHEVEVFENVRSSAIYRED